MIEGKVRPNTTQTRPAWRTLLALLLALGGVMLLAVPSGPAEAATTFTVNDSGDGADINITNARCDASTDSGDQCTLRAAMEESNDTNGADTIEFDIGGSGAAKTISPQSQLPTIEEALTIDGYTQPGAEPNTLATGNDAVLNIQLDGQDAEPSLVVGLQVEASDTTIKGLVIKRFSDYGIYILSSGGTTGNRVEGNFVGVNRDGVTDRGNSDGVFMESDSSTVGGTDPASRNVISGNDGTGVFLGTVAENNKVEGNYIGTTADGSADLGNDFDGVFVGSRFNTVGGTAAGARNVISGNGGDGVHVSQAWEMINRVEGNHIGTSADGSADLGNDGHGVAIEFGASLNIVGGTVPGSGNRIAHNGGDGVSVSDDGTVGNYVLSNSIFDNAGLGIDLGNDGRTANDTDDLDAGPNNLQNYPTITSARTSLRTNRTTVSGSLDSDPSQLFEVQCFLTDGARASGHGEGSTLLATDIVDTDANGNGNFTCTSKRLLRGQIRGQTVTATATNLLDAMGDTSEFSKNKTITVVP